MVRKNLPKQPKYFRYIKAASRGVEKRPVLNEMLSIFACGTYLHYIRKIYTLLHEC